MRVCKLYRAWLLIAFILSNGPILYEFFLVETLGSSAGMSPVPALVILASGAILWFGHLRRHLKAAGEPVA